MSRAQLTSTVEQNTGGAVAPYVGGKNKIINGDFGIWQRGTSSTASNSFIADRFFNFWDGSGTFTVSQQSFDYSSSPAADKLPISGYTGTYFQRIALNTTGSTTLYQTATRVEDVRTFAGQTFTFSFWAKANTATTLTGYIEQYFGTGGSTTSGPASNTYAFTTSWQRFSYTVLMPSITGKTIGAGNYLQFTLRSSTIASGVYFDIWGVQLEAGSVATPFTTATGTLSGELTACQRYYSVGQSIGIVNATVDGGGNYRSYPQNFLPVTMRTTPTIGITSYTAGTVNKVTSNIFFSVYGGSGADSTSAASAVTITNNSFTLSGVNSTNGKYDGANWTATAEL